MPTILRAEGFVIKIYLNDHAPAHVHAIRSEGEAVITLEPVMILRSWQMRRSDLVDVKRIVSENQAVLIKRWREIHDEQGS